MTANDPLLTYCLRLGDDALILGHRLSEWTSRAPFLEEDIALTNVALDFIGRARLFYQYAAELQGGDATEDTFAYTRDVRDFTNLLICELPRGDFAFTIARQFLYDSYALLFMEQLKASTDARLAAIAAKAEKESTYHVRRGREWMLRLGGGTEESHAKLQRAVDDLWGYTDEIFEVDTITAGLIADGVAVDPTLLREDWHAAVSRVMAEADLSQPSPGWSVEGGRRGIHTDDLGFLLAELQFMQRAYPGLQW